MFAWRPLAVLCLIAMPLRAQSQPPVFPKAFAGHAQFETTAGFRKHGWADLVAAHPGSEPYIVSVRRLLGPEGGFTREVSAAEAPAFVRSIEIDSLSGGTYGYIVGGLPVPAPRGETAQDPVGDLSIYRLHNGPSPDRVVLATRAPAAGQTVWVMTDAGQTAILKAATVVSKKQDAWLEVQLKDGTLEDDAAGAPVLNSAGELVGIYSHRDSKNPATLDLIPARAILHVLPAT